jgi:hypothetical protein
MSPFFTIHLNVQCGAILSRETGWKRQLLCQPLEHMQAVGSKRFATGKGQGCRHGHESAALDFFRLKDELAIVPAEKGSSPDSIRLVAMVEVKKCAPAGEAAELKVTGKAG